MKDNSSGNTKFIVYNQSLFGRGANKKKILRKKFDSFYAIRKIKEIEIPDNPIEISIREPNFLTSDNAQIDLEITFEVVPNIDEKDVEKFAECVSAYDTQNYPGNIKSPEDWLVSYLKSDIDIIRTYSYEQIKDRKNEIGEKLTISLQKRLAEKNFLIYSEIKIKPSIDDIGKYSIENPNHQAIIEYSQKTANTKQLELMTRQNDFEKNKKKNELEEKKNANDSVINMNSESERLTKENGRHENQKEIMKNEAIAQRRVSDLDHTKKFNETNYLELQETLKNLELKFEPEKEISKLKYDKETHDLAIKNDLDINREKLIQELDVEKIKTLKNQITIKERESTIKKEDIALDYEGERIKQELLSKTEIETQAISLVQKMLEKELLLTYFKLEKENKTETISNIANILSSSLNSLIGKFENLKTLNIFDNSGINSIINIITRLSSGLLESNVYTESVKEIIKNTNTSDLKKDTKQDNNF